MPDVKELENPDIYVASEIYSSDGKLLGKFEKEMQGRIEILVPPKDNYVFVDDRVVKPNNSK